MEEKLIEIYKDRKPYTIDNIININENNFDISYADGPKLEIIGNTSKEYNVEFWDGDVLLHQDIIKNNMWTAPAIKYFVNWKVIVTDTSTNNIVFSDIFNITTDKRIFMTFDSKSLGDTLAWIPHIEEFRKKYDCQVIVSTFWNNLFVKSYPKLQFVERGDKVDNIYAMYMIGWFDLVNGGDKNRNPNDIISIPLAKAAPDTLGLEYQEIKPIIDVPEIKNDSLPSDKKYVCIAIQSTIQAKYWNCKGGWDKVISHLKSKGYDVVCIDKHSSYGGEGLFNEIPKGVIDRTGNAPIEYRITDLKNAEFFIGLGSGLAWLSWAIGTPTIMISSFSKPFCEVDESKDFIRVYEESPSSGFFNTHYLDPSDWNWNPIQKCSSFDDWDRFEPIREHKVIDAVDEMIGRLK